MNKLSLVFTLAVLLLPFKSVSESLSAHVHGVSELMIAIENDEIEVQLISPAMDIVGFERKAKTDKEVIAVNSAKSQLEVGSSLFSFMDSSCKLDSSAVDVSSLIEEQKHEHSHSKHSHEESLSEHHHHEDDDRHFEVIANYKYSCQEQSVPTAISVNLFKLFPRMEKIQVVWLAQNKQGAVTLTPEEFKVEFD